MDSNRKKLPEGPDAADELTDDSLTVVSSTECTGLMPSAPPSEAEVDSYSEIYDSTFAADDDAADNGFRDPHIFKNDIQRPEDGRKRKKEDSHER